NLRVGANWRSVLGPLGRAVLMHRRGGAAAAATTSCRHYAAASCSGSGARGGTAGGSGQSTITKAELDAAAAAVVEAYHLCPNFEILVPALLEGGVEGLRTRCVLTPGIPIKPMLAKICDGMEDGLRQLGPGAPFLVEYKYDGVRAQIHMQPDGRVFIFSRNCEDRTDSYPDVCALIRSAAVQPRTQSSEHRADRATADLKPVRSPTPATTSCILDAEVVALEWLGHEEDLMHGGPLRAMEVEMEEDAAREDRPSAGGTACGDSSAAGERNASAAASDTSAAPYRLRAFQELATRARRQVEEHQVTVQVCVFVFDLLFWNGQPLLRRSLRERRALLPLALPGISPGRVMLATAVEMQPLTPLQAQQQQQDALQPQAAAVVTSFGRRPSASGESGEDAATAIAGAPVRLWPAPGECGARLSDDVAAAVASMDPTAVSTMQMCPMGKSGRTEQQQPVLASAENASAEDALYGMLLQAFNAGAEGLMLKRLDAGAAYEPSRRSEGWIKFHPHPGRQAP
ncbi:hypothetical protein Vafri_21003, partial [Volvox africanus]